MFRPDEVGKVFGQDHLQEVLISWMERPDAIPQSLLLSGPYGTGKTTIARIMAGMIARCGKDLVEINAANARGIDDVRSWTESTRFSPFGGGGKVYIIDELHQMTNAAQSAMLKVIEDPPKHIYFILCTTEPSRLLAPIRSRCTQLELRLFEEGDTLALLNYAFKGKLSREVMQSIHKKSGGHARDAVRMGDIAVLTGAATEEELQGQVGLGISEIHALIRSAMANACTWEQAVQLLSVNEDALLGEVLDRAIDEAAAAPVPWILHHYQDFLLMRTQRKEYRLNSKQQVLHFLSKARDYCSLLQQN
jgi:DNA polymerase III gamma/tau subunit